MAENKKTFIFYSDWINIIKEMPDVDAGKLLKHIFSYVNDENPISNNILVKMAFGHIKPLLKSDLIKWSEIRDKRREIGKKGGKANAKQTEANAKQTEAVNVNVTSNVLLEKEPKEKIDFVGLIKFINSTFGKKFKVINQAVQKKYIARIKDGYTKEDICNAITNASTDDFHKESNFKWCTPEFFSRSEILDKYGFKSEPIKKQKLVVPHYNSNLKIDIGDASDS